MPLKIKTEYNSQKNHFVSFLSKIKIKNEELYGGTGGQRAPAKFFVIL